MPTSCSSVSRPTTVGTVADVARIRVRRTVKAPVEVVWEALADIGSHVEWMADARSIRFTSSIEEGVGTTFDCDTRVGPLRLTDRMEVTEWEPQRRMAVRHVGLVTGEGAFTLTAAGNRTELEWDEELDFPWYLPSRPASLVLRLIWRWNLRQFERTLGRVAGSTVRRGARQRGRPRRRGG
jgi:uncharacterized protein YndB with AHSA1/START domain